MVPASDRLLMHRRHANLVSMQVMPTSMRTLSSGCTSFCIIYVFAMRLTLILTAALIRSRRKNGNARECRGSCLKLHTDFMRVQ